MTVPVFEILPRNGRDSEEIELLSKFSFLIEEFANFGTHVLKWDLEITRTGDEHIPIPMMFRHLLELGDSISILVKHSCIDPCKLQLRGMLETMLGIEYLLEKDTLNRAMGFMVWHHHKTLKTYKRFNPNDQVNKDLQKKIKADKIYVEGLPLGSFPNLEDHIKNLESLLSSPTYILAETEYQTLKKQNNNPPWYQLFGGPRSIEQLANYLNRQTFYEFLYRYLSGPTHGTDIFEGKLFSSKNSNIDIVQLRFAKDAQIIVQYTLSFLLLTYQAFIEKRIPAHKTDLSNWYLKIQKPYLEIMNTKGLISIK